MSSVLCIRFAQKTLPEELLNIGREVQMKITMAVLIFLMLVGSADCLKKGQNIMALAVSAPDAHL